MLRKNSKLLMIGDSITEARRLSDNPAEASDGFGCGYVQLINSFISASYPELDIEVINHGISGNTVKDLEARWQKDVLDINPDYLSIMIGINDVWRQFDKKSPPVLIDDYAVSLEKLINTFEHSRLILMTPFFIEAQKTEPMRVMMDKYGEVVKKLAKKYNILLIDTQEVFDNYLQHQHSSYIAWDRIHPSQIGHMLLAEAFMSAIKGKIL